MHFHGYTWLGEKATFDDDSLRRMPVPPWNTADPDADAERQASYRALAERFRRTEVPPVETGHWLMKSRTLIRGTWQEPDDAAAWLAERLAEYGPRFHSVAQAHTDRLARTVGHAAQTLRSGGDVSLGFYVGQSQFLSLAVVACSPNRAEPMATCPER